MSTYIRAREGRSYFFTVVTYKRRKILCLEPCRRILRETIDETRKEHPFVIDGIVLLPDHLHCIWTLPEGDTNYSIRWAIIKKEFTKRVQPLLADLKVGGAHPTKSRHKKREGVIWQRRFWEHMLRDEKDMQNHLDYIHYNPVKHGLTDSAKDWPYSSFHIYCRKKIYTQDWGQTDPIENKNIGRE